MTHITTNDIRGTLITRDGFKTVFQNRELPNMTVLSGELTPNASSDGHLHNCNEEVYHFVDGSGQFLLRYPDEDQGAVEYVYDVEPNSIVLVEEGVFHRVYNSGKEPMKWISVYNGKRREQSNNELA